MEISISDFKKAIEAFLEHRQAKKLAMPETKSEDLKGMMLFSRHRSQVFVLPTVHNFPRMHLQLLLPKIGKAILMDESLPARIEVYCASVITLQQAEELKTMMRTVYNVEMEVFDGTSLPKFDEFTTLLKNGKNKITGIDETSKMLYTLLAEGSNVSEIKSNLLCSVIVFLLNEHGALTTKQLREAAEERLQHEIGSIEQEVNFLIRKKRIERGNTNKELLTLTKDELTTFSKMKQESKREEMAFCQEFFALLSRYHIPEGERLFELLKTLYVESCGVDIDASGMSGNTNELKKKNQVFQDFRTKIKDYIRDETTAERFIAELKDICMNNPFLEKIGASEMFLSLYRSSKLEQFINSKKKLVYIDTRVFIFYYCLLVSKNKDWPYWDDHSYRSTVNLMNLAKNKNRDIKLLLFEAYLGEVAGELQKALRASWFNSRLNVKLKIPFQTTNVFYNFFSFLRDAGCMDEGGKRKSFEQFVRELGFTNINAESPTFIKDTKNVIQKQLKWLGVELKNTEHFDHHLYDPTLKEWDIRNSEMPYQKSGPALKADTSQLLHIMTQPVVVDGKEREFYYASWDRSFTTMRDWVINESTNIHGFNIYNPARMANRFALSHFKIDSKCITHDVFFYADSQFKLRQKISRLFDHVLLPLYSYKDDESIELVNLLVDLQANYLSQKESETGDEMINEKLPLEMVFDSIKLKLKEWNCTEKNLTDFLVDKNNRETVAYVFDESFQSITKHQKYDEYVKVFGDSLKKYTHSGNGVNQSLL